MKNKGFSLIEILVVVGIFALITVAITQSTAFSLRGARKSDTSSRVRDNLSFALSIMERQLRNAKTVDATDCTGAPTATRLRYTDPNDVATEFRCLSLGANGYVASGSGSAANIRITSNEVSITQCRIVCTPSTVPGIPPSVAISLTGQDRNTTGADQSIVTVDTQVSLRAY